MIDGFYIWLLLLPLVLVFAFLARFHFSGAARLEHRPTLRILRLWILGAWGIFAILYSPEFRSQGASTADLMLGIRGMLLWEGLPPYEVWLEGRSVLPTVPLAILGGLFGPELWHFMAYHGVLYLAMVALVSTLWWKIGSIPVWWERLFMVVTGVCMISAVFGWSIGELLFVVGSLAFVLTVLGARATPSTSRFPLAALCLWMMHAGNPLGPYYFLALASVAIAYSVPWRWPSSSALGATVAAGVAWLVLIAALPSLSEGWIKGTLHERNLFGHVWRGLTPPIPLDEPNPSSMDDPVEGASLTPRVFGDRGVVAKSALSNLQIYRLPQVRATIDVAADLYLAYLGFYRTNYHREALRSAVPLALPAFDPLFHQLSWPEQDKERSIFSKIVGSDNSGGTIREVSVSRIDPAQIAAESGLTEHIIYGPPEEPLTTQTRSVKMPQLQKSNQSVGSSAVSATWTGWLWVPYLEKIHFGIETDGAYKLYLNKETVLSGEETAEVRFEQTSLILSGGLHEFALEARRELGEPEVLLGWSATWTGGNMVAIDQRFFLTKVSSNYWDQENSSPTGSPTEQSDLFLQIIERKPVFPYRSTLLFRIPGSKHDQYGGYAMSSGLADVPEPQVTVPMIRDPLWNNRVYASLQLQTGELFLKKNTSLLVIDDPTRGYLMMPPGVSFEGAISMTPDPRGVRILFRDHDLIVGTDPAKE